MTDEIIKALEDLLKNFDGKAVDFMTIFFALDHINRKKAENEELKCRNQNLTSDLTSAKAEIERLTNYITNELATLPIKVRNEAYKEFAERLKKKLDISVCGYETAEVERDVFDTVDNLLAEMESERE